VEILLGKVIRKNYVRIYKAYKFTNVTNIRMTTNKKTSEKVIYPELSYTVTGILFSVHNELGSYALHTSINY